MARKYDERLIIAIDDFWRENKYPPTLRDLMKMVDIPSTSVVSYCVRKLPNIRIAKQGRIIPLWVDELLED